MAALEQRTATLDLGEACARCGVPVGAPPPPTAGPSGGAVPQLYLFPTGAAHAPTRWQSLHLVFKISQGVGCSCHAHCRSLLCKWSLPALHDFGCDSPTCVLWRHKAGRLMHAAFRRQCLPWSVPGSGGHGPLAAGHGRTYCRLAQAAVPGAWPPACTHQTSALSRPCQSPTAAAWRCAFLPMHKLLLMNPALDGTCKGSSQSDSTAANGYLL